MTQEQEKPTFDFTFTLQETNYLVQGLVELEENRMNDLDESELPPEAVVNISSRLQIDVAKKLREKIHQKVMSKLEGS